MKEQLERGEKEPPLMELQEIVRAAGFEVLSVEAVYEVSGALRFTGDINITIAPASDTASNLRWKAVSLSDYQKILELGL